MEREEIIQILERGKKISEKYTKVSLRDLCRIPMNLQEKFIKNNCNSGLALNLEKFDKIALILYNSIKGLSYKATMEDAENNNILEMINYTTNKHIENIYNIIRKIIVIPSIECATLPTVVRGKLRNSIIVWGIDDVDYYYRLEKQTEDYNIFIYSIIPSEESSFRYFLRFVRTKR